MAIPKVIHYCWFSGEPFPDVESRCVESWRRMLPDYEFVLWDMEKIKEIHSEWVDSAIAQKKWAFAADYVRLYALYNYGGVYLDCDVEVLKSFDDLLDRQMFVGRETARPVIEAAVMGSESKLLWLKNCLDFYEGRTFNVLKINTPEVAIPYILKDFVDEASVMAAEYFSPLNNLTGKCKVTPNTYCIHHFNGAWFTPYQKKYFEIRRKWSKTYGDVIGFIAASFFALANKFKEVR
ncbi:glycosyltransferase [uncultured Fibrobacter sp.]|uniref:glycosyltransferase family 32 protein n=1 Tax=uncultured Fibrobacter sp. TaxID=261512 RepID=UPI0025D29DFE|nr:glycosyltransferase [uncultured Fibrobacter sp.]